MANPLRPVAFKTAGNTPAWFREYQHAVDLWTRDAQKVIEELVTESTELKNRVETLENESDAS